MITVALLIKSNYPKATQMVLHTPTCSRIMGHYDIFQCRGVLVAGRFVFRSNDRKTINSEMQGNKKHFLITKREKGANPDGESLFS